MFVPVLKNTFDLYGTSPKSPTTSLKYHQDRQHRNSDSNGTTLRKMSASTPIPQSHSTPAGLKLSGPGRKGRHKKAPSGSAKHYYYSVPAAVALNHHQQINATTPANNGSATGLRRVTQRSPTFPPGDTVLTPTQHSHQTSSPPSSTQALTSQHHHVPFVHSYFGRRKKSLSDPALAHNSLVLAGKNIEAVKARMRKHGLGFSDESDDEDHPQLSLDEKKKRKKKTGLQHYAKGTTEARGEKGEGERGSNCLTALFACFIPSTHSGSKSELPGSEGALVKGRLEERVGDPGKKQSRRRSASAGDISSPSHHDTTTKPENECKGHQDSDIAELLVDKVSQPTQQLSTNVITPTPKISRWSKRLRQLLKMNPTKSNR